MGDQFDGWKRLLKGELTDINQDDPLSGYWRTRRFRGGPLEPVAIWRDADGLNVQCAGKDVELDKVWPYAARNPVTYAAYQARMETGKWPDIDDAVHDQQQEAVARGRGDNNAPSDPAEILKEQIESASAGAEAYKTITDDETLAKAQTLRSRLLELSGQADKHRDALKRPHLEAGTAIDAKWQPLVKGAKAVADTIRAAMAAWETVKLKEQREKEAKDAEARRVHQEAADKAAAEAAATGKPAPAPPPPQAQTIQPMPAPIKGAAGRAASVRTKVFVKSISDLDKLFQYMRLRPELSDLLLALAQKAVDAGRTDVPGIITEERAKVA